MKCSREYGQCHESSAGGTLKFQGLNFMTLLASFNNMSAASIIVSLLAIYYMHIVLLCIIINFDVCGLAISVLYA